MAEKLKGTWKHSSAWLLRQWNVIRRLSWFVIGISAAMLVAGLLGMLDFGWRYPVFFNADLIDFHSQISTELVGIGVTVIIIDSANQWREIRQEKERLIREMGSQDSGIVQHAIRELREAGWLQDGSLRGAYLRTANLEATNLVGADLRGTYLNEANLRQASLGSQMAFKDAAKMQGVNLWMADLSKAKLVGVNLKGANLSEAKLREVNLEEANLQQANLLNADFEDAHLSRANFLGARFLADDQLARAKSLHWATMPQGDRYDGRYNLAGDITLARDSNIDTGDDEMMALWYNVSLEAYHSGQRQRKITEAQRAATDGRDQQEHLE